MIAGGGVTEDVVRLAIAVAVANEVEIAVTV